MPGLSEVQEILMESATMGRVVVPARIENLDDIFRADRSEMTAEAVRRVEVSDALIDTGATMLSMPRKLIDALGLKRYRTRRAKTPSGVFDFGVYGTVRLTIQGRECTSDVIEVYNDGPVLIGQIPLEAMDWVVDPVGRRLIGNPDHGGEEMFELF